MNPYLLSISDVEKKFKTSQDGLNSTSAEERLKKKGKNELIEKKKKSIWHILLNQFKDVMIIILFIAAAISFVVGDENDAIFILLIVVLNAIIGFIQEYRAENAMAALKKMSSLNSKVRRNGKVIELPSTEIVPGDVVIIESGNIVPADLRITKAASLKIEESSLTGESHAIDKKTAALSSNDLPLGDQNNMAFKSTIVAYGHGEGIVVATGMQTEIGRIAQMLQEDEGRSPLQERLTDFSKKLSVIIIVICIILYVVGVLRGENPLQMLLTAISVAVAAIPEALPAFITITLALGAKQMVTKNALIRRLPSVETLGSVTYICSDKTGTITQNKMTVTDTWLADSSLTIQNIEAEVLFLLAMELNHDVTLDDKKKYIGDPTEIAIVEYVRKQSAYAKEWQNMKRVNEIPFDSERKRMTTIYKIGDKYLTITKGAVEAVLKSCESTNEKDILNHVDTFAEKGKRVLSFAIGIQKKFTANREYRYY